MCHKLSSNDAMHHVSHLTLYFKTFLSLFPVSLGGKVQEVT